MRKINKIPAIFFILIFSTIFTSCIGKKPDISNKKRVVTTIFPVYDWTRNIINEGNNENLLLNVIIKSGIDFHSYQASDADIAKISSADLFIYVGGDSDKWIDEILSSPANTNMIALNLMDVIKTQLKTEDMEYDEHIWLSPVYAILCCNAITEKLCQLDSENAGMYKELGDKYITRLTKLDEAYKMATENPQNKTFIFCDRFPFKNLFDLYDLKYYAAFSNCPAEIEATSDVTDFLTEKLLELNASAIYVSDTSDKKLARAVINNSKKPSCDIVVIDSLQSTTLNQAFYGKSYIKAMEDNLNAFRFN